MSSISLAGLVLVLFSAALLAILSLWKRRKPLTLREIAAFRALVHAVGQSVEDGRRLHFSLGSADLSASRSASALAALGLLRRIAERTAASDRPPLATSGDASLALLSQDTLQAGYQAAAAPELYHPSSGRLTGLTNFSYVAGALPAMRDESVSADILMGSFGPEVGLLADTAEREGSFLLAASDSLPAQAVLYACTDDPLIGEELYAAGAYLNAGRSHQASLQVQDLLRWVLVLALIGGSVMQLLGML